MGFRKGAYATVWEVRQGNGNYTDVRMSISRKDKETGEYKTEWNGWSRFIGGASQKASQLGERSRIQIGDCDVTNKYDKEKQTTYTNYAVFDFEMPDNDGATSQPTTASTAAPDVNVFLDASDIDADDLPFA